MNRKQTDTDAQRFNRLYHDCRSRFIHFAETYVDDTATAEDIVMDSLMYYWENRHTLKHENNLPAYLLKVIKHKCINHLQRERVREEVEKQILRQENWELNLRLTTLNACNPEKLFADEIRQIINRTLAALPQQSRNIFIWSKYENRTNQEIANALHLSIKSVEYHITKVLKQLRAALKDYLILFFLLMCFRVFALWIAI
ncbi:MAG: RNA polymerase sigma-70 factor [Tannerella sp.]|nr:RNA polymerase sigma-70 factor [Tannerella sp.]